MASKKYLELQELSDEDLVTEMQGLETEFQKMRFDHAIKGLDNPLELREMRRDIARLKTVLRQREVTQFTPQQIANRSKIRARRRLE
ncbi:MAG: 50S ribosomal protein L29 [Saprospiraceae bacterium]|nr:MAG: 50S ribosomal protein L29 [Saprospiraceae bacterium]